METGEFARYRRHPVLPELGLLHARYRRHAFRRHAHPSYALGVLEQGREELAYGRDREQAGAGAVVLINPEVVHTGRPVDEQGWTYHALYPPPELVHALLGRTPAFTARIVDDPALRRALLAAISAIDQDTATADLLLAEALSCAFTRYGGQPENPRPGKAVAAALREILRARHPDPPSLAAVAAGFGTSQFALLRAFRAAYGLPPHAYLTQYRLRRACALIERGTALAAAATEVGFVDQAHLTRHFRRTLGITPGQYRAAVQERTRSAR